MSSDKSVVSIYNVNKSFKVGKNEIPVLKKIRLRIHPEEFTIIYGPSGSGKSTLLNTILGLEIPNEGKIYINGKETSHYTEDQRAAIRNETFGVVYQQSYWVKTLSVTENVALPLLIRGVDDNLSVVRAQYALTQVGMDSFGDHNPMQLSGGQQQKVGIARALVTEPFIIVADEPTGNLDTKSAQDIMEMFVKLNKEYGRAIVMVTHELRFLNYAHRTFFVQDGEIKEECVGKDIQRLMQNINNLIV